MVCPTMTGPGCIGVDIGRQKRYRNRTVLLVRTCWGRIVHHEDQLPLLAWRTPKGAASTLTVEEGTVAEDLVCELTRDRRLFPTAMTGGTPRCPRGGPFTAGPQPPGPFRDHPRAVVLGFPRWRR
jgi:hypothetical protein